MSSSKWAATSESALADRRLRSVRAVPTAFESMYAARSCTPHNGLLDQRRSTERLLDGRDVLGQPFLTAQVAGQVPDRHRLDGVGAAAQERADRPVGAVAVWRP
ncbi:hypothetical protein [Actinoplanes couchii]|uniref:hypothetical protein n=1 Tax=Actinoplanes couchii TaxID=403638 RepID=UPI00194234C9|nr:hypothetical protein [Actinoplanes couchii]MDR6324055.1 hypothetical protein [Actinoplanes couchii]